MDSRTCTHCGQTVPDDSDACIACGYLTNPTQCPRHPGVEAHGVCVICDTAVCPQCTESETVHFVCPDHSDIPIFEGWAQIYSTSDGLEAELIRNNLESEGIDSEILSQRDNTLAVDLGELSTVRVLVPAFEYLDGRRILAGHSSANGEVVFACPNCGERFDETDESCRQCGAPLSHA